LGDDESVKGARSTTTTNVMMMSDANSGSHDRKRLMKKCARATRAARRFDSVDKNDLRSSVRLIAFGTSRFAAGMARQASPKARASYGRHPQKSNRIISLVTRMFDRLTCFAASSAPLC
jgi:hypothetical protein